MTKNTSSTSRKIKKRKRNKDTNLYTVTPERAASETSTPNTAPPITSLPSNTSKTEKNKKRKIKYKLKKKERKVKDNKKGDQAPKPSPSFATSTRRWKWKTLKSTSFSLKQKKLLFKVHHLSTIIERNKSIIYNLQSNLSTTSFKNNTGILTFTTQSCTQQTPPQILQDIKYLENENKALMNRILQLKEQEHSEQLKRIQHLKRINQSHGYFLRRRIYNLTTNLNNFLNHLQSRIYLWQQNTALLLETDNNLTQKSQLLAEKEKLESNNKIHNFTDINFPPDLIELLNKGTNFIPTTDKINIPTIKKTISSEVNSALSNIINKGTSSKLTTNQPVRKKTSNFNNHRYHPYTKKNPVKLLQEKQTKPHFNLHIIDYVHNTTSYSKQYLQSTNFQNLFNPQHLNITQSLTSQIQNLNKHNDIILTKTDKNMGWALVPTTWFTNEYTRQLTDSTTYKRINNFDQTITDSNKLLRKLQIRFNKLLTTSTDKQLLNTIKQDKLQLPYMKLLPKVYKLTDTASPSNLDKLTGRPIITAHSLTFTRY